MGASVAIRGDFCKFDLRENVPCESHGQFDLRENVPCESHGQFARRLPSGLPPARSARPPRGVPVGGYATGGSSNIHDSAGGIGEGTSAAIGRGVESVFQSMKTLSR